MLLPIVENFIKDNIQSVWQLELLLYIRARGCSIRSHDLAAALYTSPEAVEHALRYFVQRGLLQKSPFDDSEYSYAPSTGSLKESVDQTAKAFAERKVTIIQFIFSHQNSKTTHKAAQGRVDLPRSSESVEEI